MISSDTHIIRQQVVDIFYAGTTQEGIDLQKKMTTLCTNELIPVLENVLARYSHIQGHVYFNLLEIDLDSIDSGELENRLIGVFREKLEFLLTQPSLQSLLTTKEKDVIITDEQFRFTDDATTFVEAFIHFLQTGRLPWTFRLPAGKSLNQVFKELMNGQDRDAVLFKIKETLRYPLALRRMVLQIDEDLVVDVINSISPLNAKNAKTLLRIFSKSEHAFFHHIILERAITDTVHENSTQTVEELFTAAINALRANPIVSQTIKPKTIIEFAQTHQVFLKAKAIGKGYSIHDKDVEPQSSFPIFTDDTAGLFIDNAGLILLHPFLPSLFERTGIVNEDKIGDPNRALFLLHYLCTGQKEAPEYDLTFSKILCNLPLDQPVPSNVLLLEKDVEEADALLSSVIQHWSALQNTSQDGLRGTFLLRHGKVSTAFDGDWLLQIERKSVDILLDSLPWGIGIVKLPWLPQLIHVDW